MRRFCLDPLVSYGLIGTRIPGVWFLPESVVDRFRPIQYGVNRRLSLTHAPKDCPSTERSAGVNNVLPVTSRVPSRYLRHMGQHFVPKDTNIFQENLRQRRQERLRSRNGT